MVKIASFLQVIDDIDTLIVNLKYHRSIGVSCFLICDRGASGEALDRLMALDQQDGVRVFRLDIQQMKQVDRRILPEHRLRSYRRVFTEFDPDWVLFGDVDEFWVPASGNLAAAWPDNADLLMVPRFNAAIGQGCGEQLSGMALDYESVVMQEVVAQPLPSDGQALLDDSSELWIMRAVGSKMMSRVREVNCVYQGFHNIDSETKIHRATATHLAIVHYPFTSLARFSDKVTNIRAHLRKAGTTFAPLVAAHWRRWATQLTDQRGIAREYERQFFSPEVLTSLRQQGVVRTAREILGEMA